MKQEMLERRAQARTVNFHDKISQLISLNCCEIMSGATMPKLQEKLLLDKKSMLTDLDFSEGQAEAEQMKTAKRQLPFSFQSMISWTLKEKRQSLLQ